MQRLCKPKAEHQACLNVMQRCSLSYAKLVQIERKTKLIHSFLIPRCRLSFHSPNTSHGFRFQWIFGPVVLGIASAQFFSHFKISGLPETREVLRELHGFESRREQFHKHGASSVVNAGRLFHSETFLQAYAQHGSLSPLPIVDAYA